MGEWLRGHNITGLVDEGKECYRLKIVMGSRNWKRKGYVLFLEPAIKNKNSTLPTF